MQSNSFFVFKILLNMYIILQIPVLNFSQISVNLYQMAHPMISLSNVSSFIEVTIKISLSQAAFLEHWHRDDNFHQWNLEEIGNFNGLTQVEQRMSRSLPELCTEFLTKMRTKLNLKHLIYNNNDNLNLRTFMVHVQHYSCCLLYDKLWR